MASVASERCFFNNLPDFVDISASSSSSSPVQEDADGSHANQDLVLLLRSPSSTLSQTFLRAALDLKDEIVSLTWNAPAANRKRNLDIYKGTLGTAFLCLKVFQATGNLDSLYLCRNIIQTCLAISTSMRQCPTFLFGCAGIYALGAVAANIVGDKNDLDFFLDLLIKVGKQSDLVADFKHSDVPYELLYGRAGYLWAILFVNRQLGFEGISATIVRPILDVVLAAGRTEGSRRKCPLMYYWHGKPYWGAAHGLAGIMYCLMHFHLKDDDLEAVKGVLLYMIHNRFPESKNYPSRQGNNADKLVQWCHGAPGVALTLCKASEVFKEEVFKHAALEAGEVVWRRGLLRKVGLCHGISGNAYTFLALHRLVHEEKQLHRARTFGGFLLNRARKLIKSGEMHGGDHPHSLFEGLAGMCCLWLDLANPDLARFPGYEI